MLPIERQNLIQSLITEKKHIKISDLSDKLDVSEMTIHRDLKPLIEQGIVFKTFGGITYNPKSTEQPNSSGMCTYCNRTVHEKMAYRLIQTNNHIEVACCAHCGLLRHQQLGDKVIQAICHDFFRQTTISALRAWYVMDTSIDIGCCQPQVLTFEWKDHAKRFIHGFGGSFYSFSEAMQVLARKMNSETDNCSNHPLS